MNKENVRFTYNGILLNFSKEGNAAICNSMHGHWGFPSGSLVKNPPAMQKVQGASCSTPGSGRSPGGGHGNPLQYSCLENPMDRGAWWATVHGVTGVGCGWTTERACMQWTRGHCVTWNQPDLEGQTLDDTTYIRDLKQPNTEESRMVFGRNWGGEGNGEVLVEGYKISVIQCE